MTHVVDAMLDEAAASIRAMRAACLAARSCHARAELMRHMRATAARVADRPLDEAVAFVTAEWLAAWRLADHPDPAISAAASGFTRAFCEDARGGGHAAIVAATARLDAAFAAIGTTLADQMARHSRCAHGWWAAVVPQTAGSTPFWAAGAPADCGAPEVVS